MALYMIEAGYTADAWKQMVRKPQDRRQAVRPLAERAGCKLIEMYFTFGQHDVLLIIDAPDATAAAAVAIAAASAGHLRVARTTQLLTVEEAMGAMRKAGGLGELWSQMPT